MELPIITMTGVATFDYFFSLGVWFGVLMMPFFMIIAIISRS
ncbi:MAG: hypothetical protein RBR43_09890 [Desulfuromonadaceae bacterium]|jgi:hypothetical protein|nr:hypothetical protein [Desulfuromonadaceae bacterium]